MAGEIQITVIGRLTADPELRFTQSGAAVANFTVASNPRIYDKDRNEWVDGEATFLRASVWRKLAENAAESFVKGDLVIVQGNLKQRSYETNEGEKRTVMELDVQDMGPSIKWDPARVNRSGGNGGDVRGQSNQSRNDSQGNNGGGQNNGGQQSGNWGNGGQQNNSNQGNNGGNYGGGDPWGNSGDQPPF